MGIVFTKCRQLFFWQQQADYFWRKKLDTTSRDVSSHSIKSQKNSSGGLMDQPVESGLLLDMCVFSHWISYNVATCGSTGWSWFTFGHVLFSVIEYHTTRVATATLQRVAKFRTHLLENTVLKVSMKSLYTGHEISGWAVLLLSFPCLFTTEEAILVTGSAVQVSEQLQIKRNHLVNACFQVSSMGNDLSAIKGAVATVGTSIAAGVTL